MKNNNKRSPRFLINESLHDNLAEDMSYNFNYNLPSSNMLNVLGRIYVEQSQISHRLETELRHE